MVTKRDYTEEVVEAARSVLLELIRLLGEYSEHIVVVGGWVPQLILPQDSAKHIGSIDVDLALDHRTIPDIGYKTIHELLSNRGYEQGKQPFIFYRSVDVRGNAVKVEIDFLAGEYAGTGRSHRTQQVQDIRPRKARGADLAFDNPEKIIITGILPGAGKDTVEVKVASIPTFIIMKGMALGNRLKEKDAWDIYYCLRHYPGGLKELVVKMQDWVQNELAQESLSIISEKFSSPENVGPVHVANFEEITNIQERERIQRDAYERARFLLDELGIK